MNGYRAQFRSPEEKAKYLDAAASLDVLRFPELGPLARQIIRGALAYRQRAERLHAWVRDGIAYRSDPGEEEFASSKTVLLRGADDCDGKSRLLVALVRAAGDPRLQARIRPVFTSRTAFRHVQVEMRWPGSPWLLAEVTIKGVGLGEDPEALRDRGLPFEFAGPKPR